MELTDNGGPEILWSRRPTQRRGSFFFSFQIFHYCLLLLQWVPIVPFQIQKMSDAMYIEDKEEGMAQFLEVIAHLHLPKTDPDYPETVSS